MNVQVVNFSLKDLRNILEETIVGLLVDIPDTERAHAFAEMSALGIRIITDLSAKDIPFNEGMIVLCIALQACIETVTNLQPPCRTDLN